MGNKIILSFLILFSVKVLNAQPRYFERFDIESRFRINWVCHDLDLNQKCGWVYMTNSPGYAFLNFFNDTTGILEYHPYIGGMRFNSPRVDDFIVNKSPIQFNIEDSLVLWAGADGNLNHYPDYTPDTMEVYLVLLDTSWVDRPLLLGDYRHLFPFARLISNDGDPTYIRYSFPLRSLIAVGNTQDSSFILGFRKRSGNSQCYSWIDNISIESPKKVGIKTLDLPEVILFPNPGTDQILFRSEFPISEIKLSNILGQVVMKKQQPGTELSVSELPNGVYIYEIITNGHKVVGKWVKR